MGKACTAAVTVPLDIAAWVDAYHNAAIDEKQWAGSLGDGIRHALESVAARDPNLARKVAPVLCRLAAAAIADGALAPGAAPRWSTLLNPTNVEYVVRNRMTDVADRTRATYRSMLRRVGPILAPDIAWQPAPERLSPSAAPEPYDDRELVLVWRGIDTAPTPFRLRAAMFAVLGLGIGFIEPCLWGLTTTDVAHDDLGFCIRVGGRVPRTVPLLHTYEDRFKRLIDQIDPGAPLLGTKAKSKNLTHKLLSRLNSATTGVPLEPGRMRSTWLCRHLQAGTPLRELTEAAGLRSTKGLADLLQYVPPQDPTLRRQALHGTVSP